MSEVVYHLSIFVRLGRDRVLSARSEITSQAIPRIGESIGFGDEFAQVTHVLHELDGSVAVGCDSIVANDRIHLARLAELLATNGLDIYDDDLGVLAEIGSDPKAVDTPHPPPHTDLTPDSLVDAFEDNPPVGNRRPEQG